MLTVAYTSQQPVTDFSLKFSNLKYSATLAATTDTLLTVPGNSGFYKAVIKVTASVWIAIDATAAVPVGTSFATTSSELIEPGQDFCREVQAGDVLHFFGAAAAGVSVVFYPLTTPG